MSFGITNFLALILLQQLIGNSLPSSSKYMSILGKFFKIVKFQLLKSVTYGVLTIHVNPRPPKGGCYNLLKIKKKKKQRFLPN